jgi:hypothetical protein
MTALIGDPADGLEAFVRRMLAYSGTDVRTVQARRERHEGVDAAATAAGYTDFAIEVVSGDPRNIKVTFVEDIFRAEEYTATFRAGAWAG